MSPTPPTVLLDRSFLDALVDGAHPDHARAAATYRSLLDRYERAEVRLRAHGDALPAHRPALLAPVERISVAAQYRRAAGRLSLPVPVDREVALTLVIMRRERIRRIATFDPAFTSFDVEVEPRPEPPLGSPSPHGRQDGDEPQGVDGTDDGHPGIDGHPENDGTVPTHQI